MGAPPEVPFSPFDEPSFDELSKALHPPFSNPDVLNAVSNLFNKLIPKQSNYEYILGDDSSGRLVALLIKTALNQYRRNVEESKRIPLHFVSPHSRSLAESWIFTNRLKKLPISINKVALVVTDHISSGETVKFFGKSLQENNYKFDISTVSVSDLSVSEKLLTYNPNLANIFWGEIGSVGLNFANLTYLSGVTKSYTHNVISAKHNFFKGELLIQSRQEIKILAEYLVAVQSTRK